MKTLAILRDKIAFVRAFYKTASQPFVAIKVKIENTEEPVGLDGPANDEPPHLIEWIDAVESLNLLGQLCLCLVQRSFKDFLVGFIKNTGRELPKGRGDWFKRYKAYFLREYRISWDDGPVNLSILEELNLARNDIQHWGAENDVYRLARTQSQEYYARFPQGLFASEMDRNLWSRLRQNQPARIDVTEEKLELAILSVDQFCSYLDRVFRERVQAVTP